MGQKSTVNPEAPRHMAALGCASQPAWEGSQGTAGGSRVEGTLKSLSNNVISILLQRTVSSLIVCWKHRNIYTCSDQELPEFFLQL